MKITRKIDSKNIVNTIKAEKQRKPRRIRRYISNDDRNTICFADQLSKTLNNPYNFTYADPERNKGMAQVIKNHFDMITHNYGVNLCYFRKYNTFFEQGDKNHANMIYGEDTTAEYFLSADIRALLNITKQDWQFNMMGYQSQEEIEIWITIDEFRARFATVIGEISASLFAVPVTADLINCEYYGFIDVPEFFANIYGTMTAKQLNTLYLEKIHPQSAQRPVNSIFYQSLVRNEPLQPITGFLKGQLKQVENNYNYAVGYLKGELAYHSIQNIQQSPGWNLAPQVGDFFRFKAGQIEEEYEIQQIIDKQLGGNDALNAFLQRYVFKCKAVRRMASEQELHQENKEIGSDLEELFNPSDDAVFNTPQQQFKGDQFIKDKQDKRNIRNKKTNKLATKIYTYQNAEDNIYGGYGNSTDPKIQKNNIHQKL